MSDALPFASFTISSLDIITMASHYQTHQLPFRLTPSSLHISIHVLLHKFPFKWLVIVLKQRLPQLSNVRCPSAVKFTRLWTLSFKGYALNCVCQNWLFCALLVAGGVKLLLLVLHLDFNSGPCQTHYLSLWLTPSSLDIITIATIPNSCPCMKVYGNMS